MVEAYERGRTLVCRSNERHQWEKDRVRRPRAERLRTGSTEHDTGLDASDLVFHAAYEEGAAQGELAEVFGVPEGTALLVRTYRTRYGATDEPVTSATSYLLRAMIEPNPDLLDVSNEPWPGGTQSQLHTLGVELDRVEERVVARPPTPEEAGEFQLPLGQPVLVLRKTSYDTVGRVVEVSDVTFPGDRTELCFTTPLRRW